MDMTPPALQISEKEKALLLKLLRRHLPGVGAWAYGSRVGAKNSPSSDLDLVVFAETEQSRQVSDLRESLEESDLPFRVDLFVWEELPESFQKNIEAFHAILN